MLICMKQGGDVLPHFHTKEKSFHSPPPPPQCRQWNHGSLVLQQYQQQSCCWKQLKKGLEMEHTPPSPQTWFILLFFFSVLFREINVWFDSRKEFQAFSSKETYKLEAIGRLKKFV